jgi:hypothetical protein
MSHTYDILIYMNTQLTLFTDKPKKEVTGKTRKAHKKQSKPNIRRRHYSYIQHQRNKRQLSEVGAREIDKMKKILLERKAS